MKNEGFATVASSVYRGMVPAKNLLNRDFAINGAIVRSMHSLQVNTKLMLMLIPL